MTYKEIFNERLHSFVLFVFTFWQIILIFLCRNIFSLNIVLIFSLIFYFIFTPIKTHTYLKHLLKIFIAAFLFSLFYLLMLNVVPKEGGTFFKQGLFSLLFQKKWGVIFYSKEMLTCYRLFSLSFISMFSVLFINAEVCLLYLMQKKRISQNLGLSLLFAINGLTEFKKRFSLYKMNLTLRKVEGLQLPLILFQYLVYLIRYSENGALSLIARGQNESKLNYYDFSIKLNHFIFLFLFLAIELSLILFYLIN